MFIDSPDFSRRKVLNTNNASVPNNRPQQYQFGLQRSLLAKHVAERLNSHEQDDQILQRFRKQAEELKRQRWLSKKAKIPSPIPQPLVPVKSLSQDFLKHNQEQIYPQFKPVTSVILQRQEERETTRQRRRDKGRDALKLEQKLRSKEKQIRRKDRKLQRSRQLIEKMQFKIKELEREKMFGLKQQQLQNQKINALIEEMNYRIATNRAIFQEQLAKLKAEQHDSRKTLPLSIPRMQQEEIYAAPSLNKKRKETKRIESDRILHGPSVFYQLPKINEGTTKLNLSLLSKNSKNRLERMNPQES